MERRVVPHTPLARDAIDEVTMPIVYREGS